MSGQILVSTNGRLPAVQRVAGRASLARFAFAAEDETASR